MTAFLKIDECRTCHRSLPWEWVPTVLVNGKALSGTGVWRSILSDGLCPACQGTLEANCQKEHQAVARRSELISLLGGEKPYREFTFERYQVTARNQLAYERSQHFNPVIENLYLWGPCGVGKTHLAYAIARHGFEETLSVAIMPASQLSRKVRMKSPAEEQAAIDGLTQAEMLVLDDVGGGADTAFHRQILQEIVDTRDFADRAGLVITSKYSFDELAAKFADDSVPSRLAGMCMVIKVNGADHRLSKLRAS